MKASRIAYAALALIALLLALCVTACTTTHPTDARLNAGLSAPAVKLDSAACSLLPDSLFSVKQQHADNERPENLKPVPSHAKPGILSGIGNVFSTPEGRARRQQLRLAKASAPKVGKGGVLAINSNVSNGFKSTAAVVTADTGAVVSNNGDNSQQQAVKGDGNDVKAHKEDTTKEAPGGWATFIDNLTGPIGYALAIAAVLAFIAWRVEKKAA
jgi:hypothetical protein